jgi:hypothetical protein
MMSTPRMPHARRSTIVLILAVAALAFPLGVLANHQFTDVPTSASYHDEVESLVGAGITAGCGATTYCPGNPVTRGQMAQFLVRGLSRSAMSTATLDDTIVRTDLFVTIAAVTIEVGGVSGNQFVDVTGEVTASGTLTGCGEFCYVNARLRDADSGTISTTAFYRFSEEGVTDQDVVGKSWVFSAVPGTHTYQLQVAVFTTDDELGLFNPTVIATTHAFGSTGGSTLSLSGLDDAPTESTTGAAVDAGN